MAILDGKNQTIEMTKGGLNVDGQFQPTSVSRPKGAPILSADTLGQSQPFVPPTPTDNTSALSRIEARLTPNEPAEATGTEPAAPATPRASDQIVNRLLSNIDQMSGRGQRTQQVMEEQNVLQKELEYNKALEEFNKRDRYYENKIREAETRGGGLAMGAESEVNRLRRDRAREIADLSIGLAARQGDWQTAKTYAEDLIEAEFEPLQNEIDNLSTIYGLLQNDMSESELLEANTLIEQKRFERDTLKEIAKTLQDTKLSAMQMAQANGAPSDVIASIQAAKTPEEVLSVAGQWGTTDLLEQQYKRIRNSIAAQEYQDMLNTLNGEQENLTPEMRQKIANMSESGKAQALLSLNANLSRLSQLYTTYGTWNPINRDAANRIKALRSQLEIDIAVAGGQGAISEQEADRYQNIVGGGWFQKGSTVASAINEAIKTNDQKIGDYIEFVDSAIPGATLFEPFQEFLSNKAADDYVEQAIGGNTVPTNDSEAISQWLSTFNTQTQ